MLLAAGSHRVPRPRRISGALEHRLPKPERVGVGRVGYPGADQVSDGESAPPPPIAFSAKRGEGGDWSPLAGDVRAWHVAGVSGSS